jgi:hypothetical protein
MLASKSCAATGDERPPTTDERHLSFNRKDAEDAKNE